MRTAGVFCITLRRMDSASVMPWVGRPSVRKIRVAGRVAVLVAEPASSNWAIASSRARLMSVEPLAWSRSIQPRAAATLAAETSWGWAFHRLMPVLKLIRLKRSPGLSFSTTKRAAAWAWAIFSPCMEPEVSRTKIRSRCTISSVALCTPGAARSRKKPSSPAGR